MFIAGEIPPLVTMKRKKIIIFIVIAVVMLLALAGSVKMTGKVEIINEIKIE